MSMEETDTGWKPASEADKTAVWEQVGRLLLDPSFNKSKRYPSLLRFIVSRALEGETDSLKERILGIEVFDRKPDYDSTQDPIVRVTAAEVRKRIVKYYDDPLHQDELRLYLPTGSYVPQFALPAGEGATDPAFSSHSLKKDLLGLPASPSLEEPEKKKSNDEWNSSISTVGERASYVRWGAIAIAVIGCVAFLKVHNRTALDAFWAPTLNASGPVLICIADQSHDNAPLMDAVDPLAATAGQPSIVNSDNVSPAADLIGMIASHGHAYKVQTQARTNFSDLGTGPAILLGAYNNFWTLKLTKPLRFHFANDPALNRLWIVDDQAPAQKKWLIDTKAGSEQTKDYAIVARFVPPYTEQITTVVAGLGHESTVAGVHFILSPQLLSELDRRRSGAWRNKNLELVLETMIVNGHAGPPLIDAVYTW